MNKHITRNDMHVAETCVRIYNEKDGSTERKKILVVVAAVHRFLVFIHRSTCEIFFEAA